MNKFLLNYSSRLRLLLAIPLLTCMLTQTLKAQSCPGDECHVLTTTMNLNQAMNFKSKTQHGINVTKPGSGWTVEVQVDMTRNLNIYTGALCNHHENYPALLYGTQVTSFTNDQLVSGKIYDGDEVTFNHFVPGYLYCWSKKYSSANDLSLVRDNAWAAYVSNPSPGFSGVGAANEPIKITIALSNGVTLADIKELRIPGVEPLDGGDFVDYTNPCTGNPSYAGCDAVADFKNVSNATNKKAIVIAHRGYHGMRGEFPENSRAAVQKAYDEGFRYIEVDLRMTKDNIPIIFHDDWLGYATDFATLNNTLSTTETEEKNWSEISSLKYRNRYWDKTYKTALNAGNQYVRLGDMTNQAFNSFSQICDYISGKDIMLYLDIKSVPTNHNLEVMRRCLFIAAEKNVLHQIAVKMIRTNSGAPPDKQLIMPVATAKTQLGGIYKSLKDDLNIHIVDYSPNEGTAFITDWIAEGNVVGFEFDAANNDGMLKAPAFDSKTFPGGLSVWEYTKSQGYRTGLWSSGPLDPRGRPGHDPSRWSTGNVMKLTTSSSSYFRYKDSRSRMEIQSMVTPQYITHDRPDTWVEYLTVVGLYNSNTKR